MRVEIISSNKQKFNGRLYTRHKGRRYYTSGPTHLHRKVWEFHKGEIPKGYHVHHEKTHDDNQIEDLDCLLGTKHLSQHNKGLRKGYPPEFHAAQRAWSCSKEGKKFLHESGKRNAHFLHVEKQFKCECCGDDFITLDVGSNRFCSNKCKAKWRRDSGADDETRNCAECRKEYRINRYSRQKHCSRECGAAFTIRVRGKTTGNRTNHPRGKRAPINV